MKKKNLLLLAIISFLVVLCVLGISFAEDTESGVNTADWTCTYNEDGTVVTLNAYTGTSTDVVIPANEDFGGNVKDVRISSAVMKSIVKDKSATSISISSKGNKVIADGEDWSYAFSYSTASLYQKNTNLVSLDLSNFDTSSVTNMQYMFYYCSVLASLNLSKFNTSAVTNMGYMFQDCSSLKLLDLSSFDTSTVTSMKYMFDGCTALTSLDLSSFDTSAVTNMVRMFYNCSALSNLDLSSFNTSAVTSMGYMFQDCSALSSLDLSSFNTSAVTDMGSMFKGCTALKSLDLSSFNTSAVTSMGYMFQDCSSLTSLDVNSFNTSAVTNMKEMFEGCTALKSLNLSNFNTSTVTSMGFMFSGCTALTSLDLSRFNTSAVTDMGSMFKGCTALKSLDLSSFNTSAGTYMGSMFNGCSSLTSLDLSSFNTNNVKNMSYMFLSCTALTSLDLSRFNTSAVTDMAGMFANCRGLKTIIASNLWSTDNVASSSSMFSGCKNLTGGEGTAYNFSYTDAKYAHIDGDGGLPGYFTSNIKRYTTDDSNWKYAVSDDNKKITLVTYCGSGGDIVLPKLEDFTETWPLADTVAISKDALRNAGKAAASFKVTDSSTGIVVYDETDMSEIFSENENLTAVDLTGLDTSRVTDMSGLFYYCTALESFDFSGLDTSNVTNMTDMFNSCSALKTVYASMDWSTENVTSSTNMFYGCTNIVGQKGTTYDSTHKNAVYARIDGGPESETPGYFTSSEAEVQYPASVSQLTYSGEAQALITAGVPQSSKYRFVYKIGSSGEWLTDAANVAAVDPGMYNVYWEYQKKQSDDSWTALEDGMVTTYMTTVSVPESKGVLYCNRQPQQLINGVEQQGGVRYTYRLSDSTEWTTDPSQITGVSQGEYVIIWQREYQQEDGSWIALAGDSVVTTIDPGTTNNWKYDCSADGKTVILLTYCGSSNDVFIPASGDIGDDVEAVHLNSNVSFNKSITSVSVSSNGDKIIVDDTSWSGKFADHTALKTANLSNLDTSNLTVLNDLFSNCSELTEANLSDWNTSNVTTISQIFSGASKLNQLDLTKWDTKNVTNMAKAFNECKKLTTVAVSSWDVSKVTNMSYMFAECPAAANIDFSGWNTASVTDISGMFCDCNKLTRIDVSGWDTSNLSADGMSIVFSVDSSTAVPLTVLYGANSKAFGSYNYAGDGREVTLIYMPSEITISSETLKMTKGEGTSITASIISEEPTDQTIIWSSSNDSAATVEDGLIKAVANGTAIITATAANGKIATCSVTITNPANSITLNKDSISLIKGAEEQLTETVLPEDADDKSVTWTSSDNNVATVENGLTKAVSSGEATITATTVNGLKANCTVKVKNPIIKGDINQDGFLTIEDAKLAKRIAMKDSTVDYTKINADAGDLDKNGKITINEARKIKRAALGEITLN